MDKIAVTFDENYIAELLIEQCLNMPKFQELTGGGMEIGFVVQMNYDREFEGITIYAKDPEVKQ